MPIQGTTVNESFSIEFGGKAFDSYEIPAAALAQSLMALDGLARRASEAAYGGSSQTDVRVKAGFKQGSFIVDLIIECFNEDPVQTSAAIATVGATAVGALQGIVKLGKWAFGKKVKPVNDNPENPEVTVENELGDVAVFSRNVVNIYNNNRTQVQLSRLTQTLDMEGAESIRIFSAGKKDSVSEIITKDERRFFRQEDGVVLTDNESEVLLEVIGPMLDGSPKGWTFSEGDDGITFVAAVEDEEFLANVKNRRIRLENGTAIRAVVRTVQRKNVRTRTERSIVEVREVFPPSEQDF